jgi:hypothetical protein
MGIHMVEKETIDEYASRMRVFLKKQQAVPPETIANYVGKWIAWSPDGSTIVASADDTEQLFECIRAAGEAPHLCTLEYVEPHGC